DGVRRCPGAWAAPLSGRRLGAPRRAAGHVGPRVGRDHGLDGLPRLPSRCAGPAPGHGALITWAEVDIQTGDMPAWQWARWITEGTRLAAIGSAPSTTGTVN